MFNGSKAFLSVVKGSKLEVIKPKNITIGDYVTIVGRSRFYAEGEIYIGNNVNFADNIFLLTRSHNYTASNSMPYSTDYDYGKITIEDNVSFGIDVTVLPGVTIGEYSHIGYGSVVYSDIPPGSIVAGNPARVMMKRNMDEYDFCKRYGVSISRIRSGPNFDRKKALFEVTKKINKVLNTKNIVNNDEKFLNQFGIYSVSVMYEYSIQFDDAYLVLTNKGYAIVNNEFMKSLLAKIVLNECEIDAQNIRDNFGISLSKNQISFLTHLSLDG